MEQNLNTDDRLFKVKDLPYVHSYSGTVYCIMRLGKKYKSLPFVKGFMKHMNRDQETPNADPERTPLNKVVYGPEDIYRDTREYLKDCKINKNSTVAREILLTATPEFFKDMPQDEVNRWININIEWMKETFGEHFRYLICHYDETTIHCHGLICAKMWNEKRQCNTLQIYKYFNGIEALRGLQDSYAEKIGTRYPMLQRGVVGSKSKHQTMRKWYSIINKNKQENNIEVLQAKAAQSEMLQSKVKFLDKTIKSKEYNNNLILDTVLKQKDALEKELEELKKQLQGKDKGQEQAQEKTAKIKTKGLDYSKIIAEKKSKQQEKSRG